MGNECALTQPTPPHPSLPFSSQAFGAALTKAKAAEGGGGSSSSDRSSRQSAFEGRLRSAEGGGGATHVAAVPVPVPSGHGIGRGPVSSMTPPGSKSARSSVDEKRVSSPRSEVSAVCVCVCVRCRVASRKDMSVRL